MIIWEKKWCWTDAFASVECIHDGLYGARVTYSDDYIYKTFDKSQEAIEWALAYINQRAEIDTVIKGHIEQTSRVKKDFVTDKLVLALARIANDSGIYSLGKACELFRINKGYMLQNSPSSEEAFALLQEECKKWSDS